MDYKSSKYKFMLGILSVVILWGCLVLIGNLILSFNLDRSLAQFIINILRFLLSIPAFICIRYINNKNSLHFKNFSKSLIMGSGLLVLCFLNNLVYLLFMSEANSISIGFLSMIILQNVGTGFLEESIFRGILVSSLLIKLDNTKNGKTLAVLISGIIFGMIHFYPILGVVSLASASIQVILAAIIGCYFAAIYVKTKSLMSLIFLHALYDIVIQITQSILKVCSISNILETIFIVLTYCTYVLIFVISIIIVRKEEIKSSVEINRVSNI